MINLFEIMREAQGGHALDRMRQEFGLSPVQMQNALGAVLPAFSLGLTNSLYDPATFGPLLDLIVSDRYLPFFDGRAAAEQRGIVGASGAGGDALLRVFGSPDVTQRIAEQGSAMTGIGLDVMQRMMPLVAATLIGGLFKHASLAGIGDLLKQWADAFHRADAAMRTGHAVPSTKSAAPSAVPLDWWSGLLPNGREPLRSPSIAPPPLPAGSDPVVTAIDAWGAMVKSMLAPLPAPATPPSPAQPRPALAANPIWVLAHMFEAGRDVQAQYVGQLAKLLDSRNAGASRS